MKAVDIVAQRPDVDSTRMGVTGGSYGGFMTAWITTKTNRFKAAQADRMISDWTSWYGASDAQGLTEFEFYGKPWDNQAMYDSLSPIRYVSKVKTPTLHRAERGGSPHADGRRRAVVHGAQEAGRAGGVRALSALRRTTCRAPASRGCWSTGSAACASGSATGSRMRRSRWPERPRATRIDAAGNR